MLIYERAAQPFIRHGRNDAPAISSTLGFNLMTTLYRFSLSCVLAVVVVAETSACAPSSKGKTVTGAAFEVELSVSWSDERILGALGLDREKMTRSHMLGPDGGQSVYKHGKARLSIVRSISTGVFVTYSSDQKNFVEWDLCPGVAESPNNSIQRTSNGAADR